MDIIINGMLTALAVYVVLWKWDIYKACGYGLYIDTIFSLLLAIFYMGTYSGALVAIMGGLTLSILLSATKWLIGYKRFEHRHWVYHPR